jgi:hypothetical protein
MITLNNHRVAIDVKSAAKDLAHNPELLARLFDAMSHELKDAPGCIERLGEAVRAHGTEKVKGFIQGLQVK